MAEARRSHPLVSAEGAPESCRDYRGMDNAAAAFSEPLPEPPPEADELSVTVDRLQDARGVVRLRAREAGLGERADDLVLAVNEVLSNSLQHAQDTGALRVWDEPDALVCEVRDSGHILTPLVGREEPAVGQVGGHGVWLVNLVCDLVQVRSSEAGSTIRMKMSPA
jgi:anti-sigma regulatory factor (Ser/Thr protein kinase)